MNKHVYIHNQNHFFCYRRDRPKNITPFKEFMARFADFALEYLINPYERWRPVFGSTLMEVSITSPENLMHNRKYLG